MTCKVLEGVADEDEGCLVVGMEEVIKVWLFRNI